MNEDGDGKKPTIPLTTVSEIVSRTIDGKVKVSKSFMKLMQECGNAFIGQLATELVMRAEKDHVKTIGEKQVFGALEALGFDDMKAEVERRVKDPIESSKQKQSRKRKMLVVSEEDLLKKPKSQ
ncbi:hypothetical protein WA556_005039 [Blastocystis sp. ATCC 50177/Nand II]